MFKKLQKIFTRNLANLFTRSQYLIKEDKKLCCMTEFSKLWLPNKLTN